ADVDRYFFMGRMDRVLLERLRGLEVCNESDVPVDVGVQRVGAGRDRQQLRNNTAQCVQSLGHLLRLTAALCGILTFELPADHVSNRHGVSSLWRSRSGETRHCAWNSSSMSTTGI